MINLLMTDTNTQYDNAVAACKEIFIKKAKDYGTSWRVLRTISVVDQIFIKAQRIRTIQEKKEQKVEDDIASEWFDEQIAIAKKIMLNKNHDYGEAWRDMSQQSFADLILVKLLRIKQILLNEGKTIISEGVDANYIDIINYAVFALILMDEGKH